MFCGRAEQPLEAAPQIGGLADVGLGLWVVAPQEENSWGRRNSIKNVGIILRDEFPLMEEHKGILEGFTTKGGEDFGSSEVRSTELSAIVMPDDEHGATHFEQARTHSVPYSVTERLLPVSLFLLA